VRACPPHKINDEGGTEINDEGGTRNDELKAGDGRRRSQESEVRMQESEVRMQESEVRSQNAGDGITHALTWLLTPDF
jgi:hypothetical protein